MENTVDYIDRIEKFLDKQSPGEWVPIVRIIKDINNSKRFIEAIKFLIDFRKKPYEFNNNSYTKVRRIEYVTDETIKQLERTGKT